ncbi:hypothetical protein V6N12_012857 [Hibiscus sabdariffa]|uniref:Uncharacterized protein n=1 Tax=Hibiscus sabdariffa TaxID=183260 RepID=A0ABR2EH50_9ROSI
MRRKSTWSNSLDAWRIGGGLDPGWIRVELEWATEHWAWSLASAGLHEMAVGDWTRAEWVSNGDKNEA